MHKIFLILYFLCISFAVSGCRLHHPANNVGQFPEIQHTILHAQKTLQQLAASETVPPFAQHFSLAKGVVIFPEIYKGSYFFGIETGIGVLLTKRQNGEWSLPVFVRLSEASFGLQAGGQLSQAILILMTPNQIHKILGTATQFGVDTSVAAGPQGHVAHHTASTHTQEIFYVGNTKGLAFSMALEAGGITVSDAYNQKYYGKPITAAQILAKKVTDASSLSLRNLLTLYTQTATETP